MRNSSVPPIGADAHYGPCGRCGCDCHHTADAYIDTHTASRGDLPSAAALAYRVVVVMFFASWCPPCRPVFAHLNGVIEDCAGRDLSVIGVNLFEDFGGLTDPAGGRVPKTHRAGHAGRPCPPVRIDAWPVSRRGGCAPAVRAAPAPPG